MQLTGKTFQLTGKVQNYAWGGYTYIPQLLGFDNTVHKPCAEYWMGAHPSAASIISDGTSSIPLNEYINSNPAGAITETVFKRFGELPYLFKILDVNDMLSIQVHPTKVEAEKGFAKEELAGIPINAAFRNYKDKNHKPEVMVALSEFWLLHGFKTEDALHKTLLEIQEFNVLVALFRKEGYKGLYQFVMEMDQVDIDNLVTPLVKRELRRKANNELTKADAGWWVSKLFENGSEVKNIDRGIFSIYFFNIVKAEPGEAVFQGAGIPHAYLEGQNVELMANSDNVLRGGLTPKHIDVPELMKHTLFEPVTPNVMKGQDVGNNEVLYPCPVPDFGIKKISLNNNSHSSTATSLEIIIAIEGGAVINSSKNMVIKQGGAVAILPGESYTIESSGKCTLFKAFVPA
ncbi:mannose-6-phosphate isomerase, class I [Parasediminibacterium sp. JCM 36343]|uniref:mannose-6-phosphate isomerase, class I n=1 Tax=Parasediminibacterium sp. JCM 36343 TaxID=3374279 RepID=UPI00397AFA92